MKKLELKNNIWWIGALDYDLRVFDIIMYTEFGTTYNSYLVKGSEKTALFETVKHTFTKEYIEKLTEEIDCKKIDFIVLDHTEPDHAGTVAALLEFASNATVVGSESAISFMKEIANRDFPSLVVREGDEISLGDKTLRFIMAPFLHWPDSIYTYIKEDQVLFSCDSFGAHYAFKDLLLSKLDNRENYMKALKYYFDMIFGPFKKYMLEAIAKIEPFDIEMICPGHGPILDINPWEQINQSKEWSKSEEKEGKRVIIPYVSAYGYTRELAEKIKFGVESAGDVDVKLFDMVYADKDEVYQAIEQAQGLLFGTPTINSDALFPIMELLIHLSPIMHANKFASSFGSYGWSGEGVGIVTNRLKDLRMKVVEGYRVRFKPSPDELIGAYLFGQQFGKYVLGSEQLVEKDSVEQEITGTKIQQWRCVICGEIFEGIAPPNICPACGATKEQFEVYVPEEIVQQFTDQKKIIVIGGGIAGISTIEAIRKRNTRAEVTLIDREGLNIYYKPMISDLINKDAVMDEIFIHPVSWYLENDINYIRNMKVQEIHPEQNEILLESGDLLPYDELILATGSNSFVPPIKNVDIEGVFTIRTMSDALAVKKYAKNAKKAVVIGGGLLGLEAADQFNLMGIEVTVVEAMDRLLPRQLDQKGALILEKGILKTGIDFMKDSSVSELIGETKVRAVRLSSGVLLNADFVLISAGVRSDIQIAKKAGIACNRGILVDHHMRTNIQNIYAVGDAAEVNGISYGIWPEAVKHGKIAGANAVGATIEFVQEAPSTVFNGMNMNVFSIGEVNPQESNHLSNLIFEDRQKEIYIRLIFIDDQLNGAILIGDNSKSKDCIDGIREGYTSKHMAKLLAK